MSKKIIISLNCFNWNIALVNCFRLICFFYFFENVFLRNKKKKNSYFLCSDTNARMFGWFFDCSLQTRMINILWQGTVFFLAWNIQIFYSRLEYVISLFLKISGGVILSEGRTLFDIKTLLVKTYSCKRVKCK